MGAQRIAPGAIASLIQRLRFAALPLAFAFPVVRLLGFIIVTTYALRILAPADIGLWYVLQNIATLSGAIEMGFGNTIGRHASYYFAGADKVPEIGLASAPPAGTEPRFDLLAALLATSRRLYTVVGTISLLAALVGGGIWLMHGEASLLQTRSQTAAYVLMAIGAGLNIYGLYWLSVLLGTNRPRSYYALMIGGLSLNYLVAFVGLWSGLGVAALAMGYVVWYLYPRIHARIKVLRIIPGAARHHAQRLSIKHLWPVTWRGGAATLCSVLTIPITTIICSRVTDLATAGSYGFCMQIALLLHVLASSWHAVKLPLLARWQSQGNVEAIRRVCLQRMGLSVVTYLAGATAAILLGPCLLNFIGSRTPPLPTGQWILLMAVVGADMVIGLHAASLQTENKIPHLRPFFVSAALTVPLAWFLGQRWGVWGLLIAPLLAQSVWNYWWTPTLFWRSLAQPGIQDA